MSDYRSPRKVTYKNRWIMRYRCNECRDEHGTDNVEAVCVQCFGKVKQSLPRLAKRLGLLEAVAKAAGLVRIDIDAKSVSMDTYSRCVGFPSRLDDLSDFDKDVKQANRRDDRCLRTTPPTGSGRIFPDATTGSGD